MHWSLHCKSCGRGLRERENSNFLRTAAFHHPPQLTEAIYATRDVTAPL